MNGCSEYDIDNLVIPSGYLHYIQEHDVAFDPILVDYLMNNVIPTNKTEIDIGDHYDKKMEIKNSFLS